MVFPSKNGMFGNIGVKLRYTLTFPAADNRVGKILPHHQAECTDNVVEFTVEDGGSINTDNIIGSVCY